MIPYAEVIGDPVDHSKSPLIHEYWLGQLGLVGDYRQRRIARDELGRYLLERRSDPDWRGCNVTIPHKQAVLACLDHIETDARRIGAVNIVVPRDGGLTGCNSDVNGIATALQGIDLEGSTVVMIGAGGAARAAAAYLGDCGVRRLTILVRNPAKAEGLRTLVPETQLEILPLTGTRPLDASPAVIINASPLGMSGGPPMPGELLDELIRHAPTALFFDMVYAPLETDFIAAGRRGGAAIADGLTMLIGQAACAFGLFFFEAAPEPDSRLRALLAP